LREKAGSRISMWKLRKDEARSVPQPTSSTAASYTPAREISVEAPKADTVRAEVAHIGKSVVVKGELSGSEDLYLDGEVEGSIELRAHRLIIGPNGRVCANVEAGDVVVHGKLDGNVRSSERVELKKTAMLVGDIVTQRIVIEDGAYFKGSIDIQRQPTKPEIRRESGLGASSTPASCAAGGSFEEGFDRPSLLERKNC
jgi:cytoskeletal protein CcmA (bactofilin family)